MLRNSRLAGNPYVRTLRSDELSRARREAFALPIARSLGPWRRFSTVHFIVGCFNVGEELLRPTSTAAIANRDQSMEHVPVGPAMQAKPEPRSWQRELKEAIRDPGELYSLLGLPSAVATVAAAKNFPVFAPRPYVAMMEPGNPNDPLLRQVLPRPEEDQESEGFTDDPVADLAAARAPGLLHKYRDRVLLVTTGRCAVHCRYCFRRHFPYRETPRSMEQWLPAIEQIAGDANIREVIFSGGDPLTLVDPLLAELANRLATSRIFSGCEFTRGCRS